MRFVAGFAFLLNLGFQIAVFGDTGFELNFQLVDLLL